MTVPRRRVAVLLVAALAVGIAVGHRWSARLPDLAQYASRIQAAAEEMHVDPALLAALVAVESGGDPEAVSRVGAIGLCQLMPATAAEEARRLGIADYTEARLTEPTLNLRLGAAYLRRQLKSFQGEEAFALAAYNAGAVNVRRWRRRAPHLSARAIVQREGFAETRGHVERVLELRERYRKP